MVAFVQAGAEKRQELRDFAALFCANPNDRLANAAKPQANIDPRWELETAWNQVKARLRLFESRRSRRL